MYIAGHSAAGQPVISSAVRCWAASLSWRRRYQKRADEGPSDHRASVSEKFQRSMSLQLPTTYFRNSLLTSKSQREDHTEDHTVTSSSVDSRHWNKRVQRPKSFHQIACLAKVCHLQLTYTIKMSVCGSLWLTITQRRNFYLKCGVPNFALFLLCDC